MGYLFPALAANHIKPWSALDTLFICVNDIWSIIDLAYFMTAMGIWYCALRKPLVAPSERQTLLPTEVYRELSSEIDLGLTTFNDRPVELLKP